MSGHGINEGRVPGPGSRVPAVENGFTLLEAIVALAIFSLGAFALYGWLGVNLHTLARVEAGREALAVGHSALDLLRRVNPMETPRGRREVGELVVEWDSEPVVEPKDGMSQIGRPTLYQVGLYRLTVRVLREGGEAQSFTVRQIGWRQVRFLERE